MQKEVPAIPPTQEYSLQVTGDEVNLIGSSLGNLPYVQVAPLITKLHNQVQIQQHALAHRVGAQAQAKAEPSA